MSATATGTLAGHWNLVLAAAENVAGHARVYLVASLGLVAGLALLLAGVAVSEGLEAEALAAVGAGADVSCSWDVHGRSAALPIERVEALGALAGVERVVPRIVGRARLGEHVAIVVGVPLAELSSPREEGLVGEGRAPASAAEVLVGSELARVLGLGVGSTVALDAHALRLFTVSGILSRTSSLSSTKAIVAELGEVQRVFGTPGLVSDACVYTRTGYEGLVAEAIERLDRRYRVETKSFVAGYVARGMNRREGVFTVLFALCLALAIPSFTLLTYHAATPRRTEIALLRADGWSAAEVLELVVLENLIVSLGVACAAFLGAFVLVDGLGAPLVGSYFVPDLAAFPGAAIPTRYAPMPLLLAFLFSATVTLSGSILATWRTVTARPAEVLR